jgi:hypothetical protein
MVDALGGVLGRELDEGTASVKKVELRRQFSSKPLRGTAELSETARL